MIVMRDDSKIIHGEVDNELPQDFGLFPLAGHKEITFLCVEKSLPIKHYSFTMYIKALTKMHF